MTAPTTFIIAAFSAVICLCHARNEGHFWFVNDFHYDPTYWTTQESCNEDISDSRGKFGNYECDASWELVKASLQAAKDIDPMPDFIMWAGDNPPHAKNKSYLNVDRVLEITQNITDLFTQMWPNTQVYATMGNHDYFPTSQLPAGPSQIYDKVGDMWAHWLDHTQGALESFKRGGSYVLQMKPGYKMIVYNTNIYYTRDLVTKNATDPGNQFQWLEQQLSAARGAEEKVHILTHIPSGMMGSAPGVHWFNEHHNRKFNEIIRNNGDIILGLYGVHQHTDTFHIFYKNDAAVAVQLIVPSVTPWKARITDTLRGDARNPAIRLFTYDKDTMQLLYYDQYYLDLPKQTGATPVWLRLYQSRGDYGLNDLSPSSMHNLVVNDFEKFASDKFHSYQRWNTLNAVNNPCDARCKIAHICSIRYVDYVDYDNCVKSYTSGTEKIKTSLLLVGFFAVLSIKLHDHLL